MKNGTIEQAVKQSVLFTCVLTQPFGIVTESYTVQQNDQLLENEQLQYEYHRESARNPHNKLDHSSLTDTKINGEYSLLTEHAIKKLNTTNITNEKALKTLNVIINEEMQRHIEDLDKMAGSIYPGMQKSDVKVIQRTLNYFGYYKGEIDGLYGPLTQRALEKAEKEYDIDLIDNKALKALYEQKQTEQNNGNKTLNTNQSATRTKKKENAQETKQAEVTTTNHTDAIHTARQQIGTPYVWGGDSPGGFDCSGFIQYIFNTEGISLPRTVSDTWNYTTQVSNPSVGDLVFFETYKPGPSHMGIYIGDGQFIHASESSGVEASELSEKYWKNRYIGAGSVR